MKRQSAFRTVTIDLAKLSPKTMAAIANDVKPKITSEPCGMTADDYINLCIAFRYKKKKN